MIEDDEARARIKANIETAAHKTDLVNFTTVTTGGFSILVTLGREVISEVTNPIIALASTLGLWMGFIHRLFKNYGYSHRIRHNVVFLKVLIDTLHD